MKKLSILPTSGFAEVTDGPQNRDTDMQVVGVQGI